MKLFRSKEMKDEQMDEIWSRHEKQRKKHDVSRGRQAAGDK